METKRQSSEVSLKSVEDNYRRNSFEDRVCDDLSEVILQYLPLKYKLKLECVSKQFQRTIFRGKCDIKDFPSNASNLERMELLFKKCPHIRFDGYYVLYQIFRQIDEQNENRNYYIEKFCPKVISLRILSYNISTLTLLDYLPNVEKLSIYLFRTKSDFCSQIKLTKLRKLKIIVNETRVTSFAPLLDSHKTTLKSLFVLFLRRLEITSEVDTLLDNISNLSQLSYLRLDIITHIDFNDNRINKMVGRLPRLKVLRLIHRLIRFHPKEHYL